MEGVEKVNVGIESSLQTSKAWVQKRSMNRACGLPSSIRIDFRGLRLSSTLIDNLATMGVSSLTKAEISTAGMSTTSRPRGSVGEWRSWIWAVEASVVMLRKLTWMPWSMTRHLASSRSGMMWPMPGLERTATCGLLVSAAIVVLSL